MKKTTVLAEVMRGDATLFVECNVHVMLCHVMSRCQSHDPSSNPNPALVTKCPVSSRHVGR